MKLLADENFDNTIVRGLLRRNSNIDIIRVQDVGLLGEDDPTILAWAAQEGRVLNADLYQHPELTLLILRSSVSGVNPTNPAVLRISCKNIVGKSLIT